MKLPHLLLLSLNQPLLNALRLKLLPNFGLTKLSWILAFLLIAIDVTMDLNHKTSFKFFLPNEVQPNLTLLLLPSLRPY